jgi:hypothetical protein
MHELHVTKIPFGLAPAAPLVAQTDEDAFSFQLNDCNGAPIFAFTMNVTAAAAELGAGREPGALIAHIYGDPELVDAHELDRVKTANRDFVRKATGGALVNELGGDPPIPERDNRTVIDG